MNQFSSTCNWCFDATSYAVSQYLRKYFIIIFLGSFFVRLISFGAESSSSILTDIHFSSNGSGYVSMTVNGSNVDTIAEMLGITKEALSKHSLDFYLKEAFDDKENGLKNKINFDKKVDKLNFHHSHGCFKFFVTECSCVLAG